MKKNKVQLHLSFNRSTKIFREEISGVTDDVIHCAHFQQVNKIKLCFILDANLLFLLSEVLYDENESDLGVNECKVPCVII